MNPACKVNSTAAMLVSPTNFDPTSSPLAPAPPNMNPALITTMFEGVSFNTVEFVRFSHTAEYENADPTAALRAAAGAESGSFRK